MVEAAGPRPIRTSDLSARERYELLTSLVVPRPIGWISTWGPDRVPNLAPYSYFAALSASPMLVGVSIGMRRGRPKDTLSNARSRESFCVNVVDVTHLEPMNRTSIESPASHDEFAYASLQPKTSSVVDAPYVGSARAVLHCALHREVDIGSETNVLIVGRVEGVSLDEGLERIGDSFSMATDSLQPVGRLWGAAYALPGEILNLARPRADDAG